MLGGRLRITTCQTKYQAIKLKMILYDIHVKQPSYSTRKKYPISDFSILRFLLTGHFVWWNMKFVLFIWHWYYTMFYTRYFLLVLSSPVYCWSCFSCVFQDSTLRPSPERLEHAMRLCTPNPFPTYSSLEDWELSTQTRSWAWPSKHRQHTVHLAIYLRWEVSGV